LTGIAEEEAHQILREHVYAVDVLLRHPSALYTVFAH
jgi:hypothetical protein